MKRTAVLLDLAFVLHKLSRALGRHPTAVEVRHFAERCLRADEELFRIYVYHCWPYDGSATHPMSREQVDFKMSPVFTSMQTLLHDLEETDGIAFRAGELSFDGWVIRKRAIREIARSGRALRADDYAPDLKQKRVDMKIGLDVAWLSSKRIVDRLVLVASDSDFVPAMKFARREGVSVVLVTLGHQLVKRELRVHADEHREVPFP